MIFEEAIYEIASNLCHPLARGIADHACDLDSPGLEVDDEEDVVADQTYKRQDFHDE